MKVLTDLQTQQEELTGSVKLALAKTVLGKHRSDNMLTPDPAVCQCL